jgi:hypothetical protein
MGTGNRTSVVSNFDRLLEKVENTKQSSLATWEQEFVNLTWNSFEPEEKVVIGLRNGRIDGVFKSKQEVAKITGLPLSSVDSIETSGLAKMNETRKKVEEEMSSYYAMREKEDKVVIEKTLDDIGKRSSAVSGMGTFYKPFPPLVKDGETGVLYKSDLREIGEIESNKRDDQIVSYAISKGFEYRKLGSKEYNALNSDSKKRYEMAMNERVQEAIDFLNTGTPEGFEYKINDDGDFEYKEKRAASVSGMGAGVFYNTVIGKYKDPNKAMSELRDEAIEEYKYEYGEYDGYSGTIAEKHDFVMIPLPPRKNPYQYIDELIDNDDPRISDKWGPAGCIEVPRNRWKNLFNERTVEEWKGKKGVRAYIFFGWASS